MYNVLHCLWNVRNNNTSVPAIFFNLPHSYVPLRFLFNISPCIGSGRKNNDIKRNKKGSNNREQRLMLF